MGIFTRALMEKKYPAKIIGYEIDDVILNEARALFAGNDKIDIRNIKDNDKRFEDI